MNPFYRGMSDELVKLSVLGTALGGKLIANAIAHAIINTKASPKVLREFIESAGDDFMAAGFRHAITGKKIGPVYQAAIGTTITPSGPYMYNTGHKYGVRVRNALTKVPLVGAEIPFHALRLTDMGISSTLKAAPVGGAIGGATYGYLTGKSNKNPVPLKSIASGAIMGGLVGRGAKAWGPHAPVVKQLKWVRERVVDPTLSGAQTPVGRILDRLATKAPSPKAAKAIAEAATK